MNCTRKKNIDYFYDRFMKKVKKRRRMKGRKKEVLNKKE